MRRVGCCTCVLHILSSLITPKLQKETKKREHTRLLVEGAASRGAGGPSWGAGGLLIEAGLGLGALLLVLVHLLQFLLCLKHPQPHLRQMYLCAQPYKCHNRRQEKKPINAFGPAIRLHTATPCT